MRFFTFTFRFHLFFVPLTFGLRYSRSEKYKFICFFARLFVPLQAWKCLEDLK